MKRIAIFSQQNDFHGHAVYTSLSKRAGVAVYYVATDGMLNSGRLNWNLESRDTSRLGDHYGQVVEIASLDAIWWRRVNQPQLGLDGLMDEVTRDLVDHEWRAAIFGTVLDAFRGRWINDPFRDALAGNKIVHLTAARKVGFQTPRTLVSQEPEEVRSFCMEVGGKVIAKKLVGTVLRPLATVLLSLDDLQDDTSLQVSPTIYQELISTTQHLRVCCFGDRVSATMITSEVLDWRRDLSVPFTPYELDRETQSRLKTLIESLGLRMGVMDMMIDEAADRLVWLELNTQGQFLFVEAKSGVDLTNQFTDFLIDEVSQKTQGEPTCLAS
jgi:glutathione synthase/RimK-type ligase-like ATP-grasp enzyme